jgi:hypothetical protein
MAYLQEYLAKNASSDVQGRHTVYWVPFDVFQKLPIERWQYNRPPDEGRVAEIREWMRTSERVDGIIHLAAIGPKLVCYESNHRREAMEGLTTLHNVLVDTLWGATDEEVKREFFRLNKAVSVPDLYVTEAPGVQLDELRKAVDAFCENKPKEAENAKKGAWSFSGTLSHNPPIVRNKFGGRWLTTEFEAGDFLTFGMFVVHASLDNRSENRLRISSDARFQRASEPIDERWVGVNPPGHSTAGKRGRIC